MTLKTPKVNSTLAFESAKSLTLALSHREREQVLRK
jgi:hypothetical protein